MSFIILCNHTLAHTKEYNHVQIQVLVKKNFLFYDPETKYTKCLPVTLGTGSKVTYMQSHPCPHEVLYKTKVSKILEPFARVFR